MPCSPDASQAMAVWGRSPRILPTSWVSTRPGPASTNTRTPAAYMRLDLVDEAHRAGHLLGELGPDRGRLVGVGRGRWRFDHTGTRGGATSTVVEPLGEQRGRPRR